KGAASQPKKREEKTLQDVHDLPSSNLNTDLDLQGMQDLIFSKEDGVQLVPTFFKGTLPQGITRLLLGRSSNYKNGLEVSGVIDSDFQGEIKVIVKATKQTYSIKKGQRIAQLLLLPYLEVPNPGLQAERWKGQYGSSDVVAWVTEIGKERPFKVIRNNGRPFKGILDTGADKICIAGKDWPKSPVCQTSSSLQGLGMVSNVARAAETVHWKCEAKERFIHPYVIPSLPFSLWGRDIMEYMSVRLMT
nr:protease [dwarf hamster endogenous retrovirus MRS-Ps, Peptide, 246 aa] [Dwarf hamster endogenous retrovirus MRS-Ps]